MPLSITTQLITEAAQRRNWSVEVLNDISNLVQITTPQSKYYVRNTRSFKGSGVNEYISKNKYLFYQLASSIKGVEQPATELVTDSASTHEFLKKYKHVVVKPLNQSHGNGITVGITDDESLRAAIERARVLSSKVLLQQQISGDDYRVLVIDGRIVAASIREPAYVIGDDTHTIAELIELENQKPERGPGYSKSKSHIDTASAEQYLGEKLQSVPGTDEKISVIGVANIGRGGTAIDVTDTLSDTLINQTQAVIEHFRYEFVGIDFIVDATGRAYLIEANTFPSFGLHAYPAEGKPRLVAEDFLDWLTK